MTKRRRDGISTFELVMILATVSVAAVTLVPSCRNMRAALAVEHAARSLDDVNTALAATRASTNNLFFVWTRDDVEPVLVWPKEAPSNAFSHESTNSFVFAFPRETLVETFDYDVANGAASVSVLLRDGIRRVTADDAVAPR